MLKLLGAERRSGLFASTCGEVVRIRDLAERLIWINGLNSVNPSGVDHLVFSVSLPAAAGNTFQGQTATLSLAFTATQRTGSAR